MSDIDIPDDPEIIAQRLVDYIFCFFGQPGIGKTTFVLEVFGKKKTLFISTDHGTRDMKCRRVECNTWKRVRAVFKKLEKKNRNVEVMVFDHVDDFANMIEEYVCEFYTLKDKKDTYTTIDSIPHGRGWAMLKKELNSLVHRTLALGVCPVFIAHEDIKTVRTGGRERDKIMPSMTKQMQKVVLPIANIVGQITKKKVKVKGGKLKDRRVLVTEPREDLYVKDRTLRNKPDHGWELLDAEAFKATFGDTDHEQEEQEEPRRGRRARH
jgi:hypothetical protein